jgi:hypothetical protein
MKTVYSDFALTGNIVALGGNLWNEKLAQALRHKKKDESELRIAAGVFFNEILPELQNFMEQKLKAEDAKWRGIVPIFESVVAAHPCEKAECSCREMRSEFESRLKGQDKREGEAWVVTRACKEHPNVLMKPFKWGPPPWHPCPNCTYERAVENKKAPKQVDKCPYCGETIDCFGCVCAASGG